MKFKSIYNLDKETYKEFSKGYVFNKKNIIIYIFSILMIIANLLIKNYYFIISFCVCILVFVLIFLLKKGNNYGYNRMLVSNNGIIPENEITIDDNEIIAKNLNSKSVNNYSFENIIGITETKNLIILKLKYNLGLIINKNTLTGGSSEELITNLLNKCVNVKKKINVSKFGMKLNLFYLIFIFIFFVISLFLI